MSQDCPISGQLITLSTIILVLGSTISFPSYLGWLSKLMKCLGMFETSVNHQLAKCGNGKPNINIYSCFPPRKLTWDININYIFMRWFQNYCTKYHNTMMAFITTWPIWEVKKSGKPTCYGLKTTFSRLLLSSLVPHDWMVLEIEQKTGL